MKPRPHKYGAVRTPTESAEQKALFVWLDYASKAHPELRNAYAVPNGGARTAITGARLKREGVRPGVPDINLDWPGVGGFLGLRIELKRTSGGRVSPEQADWHRRLRAAGYRVAVCAGWVAAANVIADYCGFERQA